MRNLRTFPIPTLAGLLALLLTAADASAGCGGGGSYTASGCSYHAATQGYFVSGPPGGSAAPAAPYASAPAPAPAPASYGQPPMTYNRGYTRSPRMVSGYGMPYSYRR